MRDDDVNEEKYSLDRIYPEAGCMDVLEECYRLYGKSVVLSRAIPCLYDGLKPVQKRLYFTMYKQGYTSKLIKSTAVCADVQKYFHPHGESSVYSALAKLAQKFYTRVPAVDTQGNWGSDEDAPAASRYTECKGNNILKIFTEDLRSDVVPMVINYAGSDFEPLFLPARIPMIFVNGSYGIAVGYATSILPHNINEVCDGMEATILNKGNVKAQDYLKGPDFPLGGQVILGDEWIRACETGRGYVTLRARYKLRDLTDKIIEINFYELPYRQVRHQIISSLNDAHERNLLPGVVTFADVSDRRGISLVVHVKRQFLNIALERIFRFSRLECRLHINNVVVMDNRPMLMDYQSMMNNFIIKRRQVATRKISFRMNEIKERLQKLRVNLVLFQHSDEIITIIKNSNDPEGDLSGLRFDLSIHGSGRDKVPENLHLLTDVKSLGSNDIHYLLTLTIARLKKRHGEEVIKEIETILKEYHDLNGILLDSDLLDRYIIDDMREALSVVPETVRNRRSIVEDQSVLYGSQIKSKDLVILYENSIVGRYLYESFQSQKRGGKGKKISEDGEISILNICECGTGSRLVALTNLGNVRPVSLESIPYYFETDNLYYLGEQFRLQDNERVINILNLNDDKSLMLLLSDKGKGKLIDCKEIRRGKRLMRLVKGEQLRIARLTSLNEQFVVFTKSKALRCRVDSVRLSRAGSGGIRLIRIGPKDSVISLITCDESGSFYLIYSNGLVKLNSLKSYRLQSRGGMGVRTNSPRSSDLIGVRTFEKDHLITVILSDGRLLKSDLKLQVLGRRARGVRLIDVNEAKVVGVC